MKLNLKLKLAEGAIEFFTHRSCYEVLTNVTCELRAVSSSFLALACWKSVCTESWKSGNPSCGSKNMYFLLEYNVFIKNSEDEAKKSTLILIPEKSRFRF